MPKYQKDINLIFPLWTELECIWGHKEIPPSTSCLIPNEFEHPCTSA